MNRRGFLGLMMSVCAVPLLGFKKAKDAIVTPRRGILGLKRLEWQRRTVVDENFRGVCNLDVKASFFHKQKPDEVVGFVRNLNLFPAHYRLLDVKTTSCLYGKDWQVHVICVETIPC
jgi:hypothetical protein